MFSLSSSVSSQISTNCKPLGFKGIKCSFQVLLELLNSGLEGVALREVNFVLIVVFFTELGKEDWLFLSKLWVSYLRQSVSALDNIILQLIDLFLKVLGKGSKSSLLLLSISIEKFSSSIPFISESINLGIGRLLESCKSGCELGSHRSSSSSSLFLSEVNKVVAGVGEGNSKIIYLVVEKCVSCPEWLVELIGEL